ncbi:MAG: S-layer homology domain-containing protein [Thermovirgaceae bacterium]
MKKFVALVAVAALVAFAAPAFAANPFMDVPMNHWAYDAVSQLAARGIVTGYPDGAFKGEWKATRYEMASVVARALAYVDMNKASTEDLELLKRLVVEFKDELDALGVKVEDLDDRVDVLERDIGGWSFWGELRLDAKWGDNDGVDKDSAYGLTGDTDFNLNRYRIYMRKKFDDKLTFTARIGKSAGDDMNWQRYYVTIKMPWDSTAMIGKWNFDWEGEDGWYIDNDAWFTDQTPVGFYWSKPFGTGQFDAFVAHMEGDELDEKDFGGDLSNSTYGDWGEGYFYGLRLKYAFNEQFGMGLVGIMKDYDETWLGYANDWAVYWAQAYVNFTPSIQLRGRYMMQDLDKAVTVDSGATTDDPSALQAILQVDQEALGFTSLWIEYADIEEGFHIDTADPYADWGNAVLWAHKDNKSNFQKDTEVLFIRADQKWNDKWATFQRFIDVDDDFENAEVYTFGVAYWYTPSIKFELSYDDTSYDLSDDDSMIRLRTHVWF